MSAQKTIRETIPLWLAVALTVLVAMPFGLWFGKYNFTLWCAFIVWAEYFTLGAKPAALRLIIPSFGAACAATSLILFLVPKASFFPSLVAPGDLGTSLVLAAGFGVLVYAMRWSVTLQQGSLPFFNGMTMTLAVFFTSSFPQIVTGSAAPFWAGAWTFLMGMFGALLGVLNVWLTFPREVRSADDSSLTA